MTKHQEHIGSSVIIGGGVAGLQAARTLRSLRPEELVTIIDVESEIGYFRTLLPQFMNRSLPESKLFFWHPNNDSDLRVITAAGVDSVDLQNRLLTLSDNRTVHYRRLLIASGGSPIVPAVCRSESCTGIFPVRGLATARAAREWLVKNPQVVIIGGGLVGVKTAVHLAGYNITVTLIERERQLLPQALSAAAAQLVQTHLEGKNIRLFLGATVQDIHTDGSQVRAVQVNDQWLPAQTVLIAAGSLPELSFLNDSDLLRDGRLEVSPTLQTSDQTVFAAGDAVTIVDNGCYTPWTWPQAVIQGRLAALNLHADTPQTLQSLTRVNSMNLNGLSLAVLGAPVTGTETITFSQPARHIHRELFLSGGRIVGGALLGDISQAGSIHLRMNRGQMADYDIDHLLKPSLTSFSRNTPGCTRLVKRALLAIPER